jgi:hypothetical protein
MLRTWRTWCVLPLLFLYACLERNCDVAPILRLFPFMKVSETKIQRCCADTFDRLTQHKPLGTQGQAAQKHNAHTHAHHMDTHLRMPCRHRVCTAATLPATTAVTPWAWHVRARGSTTACVTQTGNLRAAVAASSTLPMSCWSATGACVGCSRW